MAMDLRGWCLTLCAGYSYMYTDHKTRAWLRSTCTIFLFLHPSCPAVVNGEREQ